MGGIAVRARVRPVRCNYTRLRSLFQHPPKFAPEMDTLWVSKVLNEVRAVYFLYRVVFPRPLFPKIVNDVHTFKGDGVHIQEPFDLLLASTKIQFHAATFFAGASHCGWSTYTNGAPGARPYITGTTPGSVTGTPYFKGIQVLGIYSNSTSTNLIATRYCVLLSGSLTSGVVTGLIINGTNLTPTTGFYDDLTGATSFYFDVGASSTLISASSTAVIY